jgi:hypothetical protein
MINLFIYFKGAKRKIKGGKKTIEDKNAKI